MHSSLIILSVAAAMIAPALAISAPAQYCAANQSLATTKYPNKCQIAQIFSHLGQDNFTAFFAQVAPDVHWTLMGTHPLAGEYHNRTIFVTNALERLANTLINGTSALDLVHIVGGGDEEWSVQELHGVGVCKNGRYSIPYSSLFACLPSLNLERGTLNQKVRR